MEALKTQEELKVTNLPTTNPAVDVESMEMPLGLLTNLGISCRAANKFVGKLAFPVDIRA